MAELAKLTSGCGALVFVWVISFQSERFTCRITGLSRPAFCSALLGAEPFEDLRLVSLRSVRIMLAIIPGAAVETLIQLPFRDTRPQ